MSSHSCFWLEPTEDVEIHLRRYAGGYGSNCCSASGYGYHNQSAIAERGHQHSYPTVHGDVWPHNDPRWPTACVCGYVFQPADKWQFNPDQLYRRLDTGERVTMAAAPAGAMVDTYWQARHSLYRKHADGIMLSVKLPDSTWWCVDGPAYVNGVAQPGGWTRSGAAPLVSATPSIRIGGDGCPMTYHGFLTNGVLNSTPDSPC